MVFTDGFGCVVSDQFPLMKDCNRVREGHQDIHLVFHQENRLIFPILDVFKKLEVLKKNSADVVINWYYEEDDEDMLEAGEDYESIIKVPFKMIQIVD